MRSSRHSAALALLSASLLTGCASMGQSFGEAAMFYRDYIGPVGQPDAALMRISADGAVRITPDSSCADFAKPETGVALFSSPSTKDYSYLHGRKLGVRGEAPPGLTSTEVALQGDKPVVLSFTRTWVVRGTAYTCQVHRSFVPNAGAQYQLQAEPLFADGQCAVQLTSLSDPPAPAPLLPARLCGA